MPFCIKQNCMQPRAPYVLSLLFLFSFVRFALICVCNQSNCTCSPTGMCDNPPIIGVYVYRMGVYREGPNEHFGPFPTKGGETLLPTQQCT